MLRITMLRILPLLLVLALPATGCMTTSATRQAQRSVAEDAAFAEAKLRADRLLALPAEQLTQEDRLFLLTHLRDTDRRLDERVRRAQSTAVAAGAVSIVLTAVSAVISVFVLTASETP